MSRLQSLADYLGTTPVADDAAEPEARLENIAGDPKAFCEAVLNSIEFRRYIINSLTMGSLPPAILMRVMDTAGWPKAPKRVEHTGDGGGAIVTEIRRVLVRVDGARVERSELKQPSIH